MKTPVVVIVVSVCAVVLGTYGATSQAQPARADRPAFAVASVRPHKSDDKRPSSSVYTRNGVNFVDRAAGFIVAEAYHFPLGRVVGPESLTDEKLWGLLSESYDVVAKADRDVSKEELRLMLQSLLAERFRLSLHVQARVAPVYKLTIAKNGPRLQEADGEGTFNILHSRDAVIFQYTDMMRFSNFLTGRVDRVVIDQTGLKGSYNFTLKRPEDPEQESTKPNAMKSDQIGPDSMGSNVLADSLKALGLQLVKDRAPVEYLVIDHVEKATRN